MYSEKEIEELEIFLRGYCFPCDMSLVEKIVKIMNEEYEEGYRDGCEKYELEYFGED